LAVHQAIIVNQFVEHAVAALKRVAGAPEVVRRSSLAGVIEFTLPKSHGSYAGLFIGSEHSRRISCVIKFPCPIDDGIRAEVMLLCFLVNPTLDLGQLEFTHSGNELIAKVTQCVLPDHECNGPIIEESISTAIRLMNEHADCIRSVINGDMKAANAFHTKQFLAESDAIQPLDISDFEQD
jgi:hypothetical protein